MGQATVSAGLVDGFLSFAEANGAPRKTLLDEAGVRAGDLQDTDNRIPLERYKTLVRCAKDICGDASLSLRWGAAIDMADVSIVGLIMNASRTMGEAFAQLQRFNRLALEIDTTSSQPRFILQHQNDELWMIDTRLDANAFPEITEVSFARLVCGPRRFLDRPHVLEVCFTHAEPGYRHEYDRIFQCPIRFSSHWNAMRLAPDIASWPVALEPKYVLPILSRHAEQLLETISNRQSVRTKVENQLLAVLHKGDCTAEAVAAELGLSRQSLYRKLRDEGTNFSDILDTLRERLATELLKTRKASVNETAYLLGFSDPASFSRAFKRWTGKPPNQVKA